MKTGEYLTLDGVVSSGHLKEEVERQYRRMHKELPIDRFLCRPQEAIGFAAVVRDRLGSGILDLPDHVILETLINLRKRGQIKTGEREA